MSPRRSRPRRDRASKTVEAEIGDRVQITVEGADADSVALGDLAMEDVEAGFPARFELLADTPGTYPLVLVNENRRIGTWRSVNGSARLRAGRTEPAGRSRRLARRHLLVDADDVPGGVDGLRKYGGER